MLSDEEKEALERIDYIQDFIIENGQYNADVNDMEYFSKVLNLIEKQQKEIEELKQNIHLKEVYVLKTNDYIKGTNDADKLCNKKWEDKIKAKIEELNKEEKKSLKGTKGQDRYSIKLEYMHKRNALQELLEESDK